MVAREGNLTTLVGSCKWTNAPMDLDDAARLRKAVFDCVSSLTPAERPWWALFSREGFSSAVVEMAKHDENHLLLYRPDDLSF